MRAERRRALYLLRGALQLPKQADVLQDDCHKGDPVLSLDKLEAFLRQRYERITGRAYAGSLYALILERGGQEAIDLVERLL